MLIIASSGITQPSRVVKSPEGGTLVTYMKTMRICIPIQHKDMGGMYTFLANWRTWLDRQGIWYTEAPQDEYNVLFVNSWAVPYDTIRQVKQQNPYLIVVQRVDGSARDYGRWTDDADERQARVNMLVDLTIFQSHYSKCSTQKKFKVIRQDGPIIYNPVDTHIFRPDGPFVTIEGKIRVCNAAFSVNRKKGTWQLGRLARQNPEVMFVLCGHYPDLPQLSNIRLLGHLKRNDLAQVMRSCDVFLHLAENDPCPNVITEALASGLPVLYKQSGGTPELVRNCGLPVTPENFSEQIRAILTRQAELSRAARQRAVTSFSPEKIFPQYLTAIARAKRKRLPSKWDFLWAALWGYPVLPYPRSHLPRRAIQKLFLALSTFRKKRL
jgi:glycosyltransferase involved in cell wall biosynthesis